MNNDIRVNGWGVKKVTEVNDGEELMNIFQTFYSLNDHLPLSNGLLVVPDGDAPPGENKVNMKQLYELFKNNKIPRSGVFAFSRSYSILSREEQPLVNKKCNNRILCKPLL